MSEAISTLLGAAFAAFVVRLTVRFVNRRERWARRTLLGLTLSALYLLSAGPQLWLAVHGWIPAWMRGPIEWFYWPLDLVLQNAPDAISRPIMGYIILWGRIATGRPLIG